MLINLVPDFLSALSARDPLAAYYRYLETHRPVLSAYWRNYVLDLESPHADEVIRRALAADRRDLHHLLGTLDVVRVAEETLRACEAMLETDTPIDLYLMVGVGGANAGELVVGGRGMAFVCLEHFTGRPNPDSYGLGLSPGLLPLWIAHEVAHAVRYTSPRSEAELARIVADAAGTTTTGKAALGRRSASSWSTRDSPSSPRRRWHVGSSPGTTSATRAASIGACGSWMPSCAAHWCPSSTSGGSVSGFATCPAAWRLPSASWAGG